MALILKFLPIALATAFLGMAFFRYSRGNRRQAAFCLVGGYVSGLAVTILLVLFAPAGIPYLVARILLGFLFGLFLSWALFSLYRFRNSSSVAGGGVSTPLVAVPAGFAAAFFSLLSANVKDSPAAALTVILAMGALSIALAWVAEKKIFPAVQVTAASLFAAAIGVFCFISAHSPRLDIFSALSMKIMKFIHDFVHQGFETLLIPDHPFFRTDIWNYIGFLFSNSVGFWGGLVIWLLPSSLVLWMVAREPLPQVSHIRQGAMRRKMVAGHMAERRWRAVVPALALVVFCLSIYRSVSPIIEYWDPKPIKVAADAGGEVVLPLHGDEYDLADGKIHKFLLTGKGARFFVLLKPDGKFAVALDACSICKPEGYGQADDSVLCYYCNTLIPIRTIGATGGCNPVPVSFMQGEDSIRISGAELANTWASTVQSVMGKTGSEP